MKIVLSAKAEDLLERLYMTAIEGASPSPRETDQQAIDELRQLEYISEEHEKVLLTKKGRKQAEQAVRRHRLAERLLHDIIDVKGKLVDATACEFEHSLHHGIDEHICTLLGHPKTCPHGRAIPAGKCCRERKGKTQSAISSLAEMHAEERGTIAYLSSRQPEAIQKLMALGVLPGGAVQIIQVFPSVVFQVGMTQLAVDKALAGDIFVRRRDE